MSAFFIIAYTMNNWPQKFSTMIVLVIAIALFFFIGFWVEQLFLMELVVKMGLLGLLFGIFSFCTQFLNHFLRFLHYYTF